MILNKIQRTMLVAVLLSGAFGSFDVGAQVTTAGIEGTVKDQTGAVVPRATVTVRNRETGVSRTAAADEAGRFIIPQLAVGSYEAQAEQAGFRTEVHTGITLTVGRDVVVDFTLAVGEVSEKVEVTADAPVVNTTTSAVSGLVDDKKIRELPLNGRDYVQLALLQAGAASVLNASTQVTTNKGFGRRVSIAGARPSQTAFLLDGATLNNTSNFGTPGSAAGVVLGVDTIREFEVLVNGFSAEYGNAAGGVINAVTKSGSNALHGNAFEFLRNSALDARNFFDKELPPFRRNQFGGTLGGPIRKDKTFYFGGYEGLRQSLGQTLIASVPTLAARDGILPTGRVTVAPAVKPFFALFPAPNGIDFGNGTAQSITAGSSPTTENNYVVRIDHNFNSSDSIFGRLTADTAQVSFFPNPIPNFSGNAHSSTRYLTLEEKKIFSPRLLNELHFSFNRTLLQTFDHTLNAVPADTYFVPGSQYFGTFTFGTTGSRFIDNPGVNGSNPNTTVLNLFQYKDTVTYFRGAHSLAMGFNFNRYRYNLASFTRPGGEYTFSSLQNFLLGTAQALRLSDPNGSGIRGLRQSMAGLFVQDDFRVRPNLMLNLGVRYEFITVPNEHHGRFANLRNVLDSTMTIGAPILNPSLRNFAPRLGIAWDPFGKGTTSVRAGFGFYYDQMITSYYNQVVESNPPFFLNNQFQNPAFPNALQVLRTTAAVAALAAVNSVDYHAHQPYVMQYNLSIERQLSADTAIRVSYVGSHGNHLQRIVNNNPATPVLRADGSVFMPANAPRLNPNFAAIQQRLQDSQSFYNSVQFNVTRRFSGGLQLQGSYTFAKSIDDDSTGFGPTDYGNFTPNLDIFHRTYARGLSAFDIRHGFTFNATYLVPWGNNLTGIAGSVLKGWQVGGIGSFTSGSPFYPVVGFDIANVLSLSNGTRPNLIPGFSNNPTKGVSAGCAGVPSGLRLGGVGNWFDPCAFSLPAPGTLGNLGRNTIIGPGLSDLDFSVMKNFYFGKERYMQFRGEFFNILNHANFANPTNLIVFQTTGRIPSAGNISTTVTASRQIQFGLKLVF